MMSPKVSVVVPVYNSEKYLRQCIDSLVNQTLREVEFIFVDDGSTDRSLEILTEYRTNDSRIQIIRQKNQFAGVARNNGMVHATGKYIIFLDSDDFFEPDMLEICCSTAEKKKAEIVLFGYDGFDNNSKKVTSTIINQELSNKKDIFSAGDLGEKVFECTLPNPWTKFVWRSYLNQYNILFKATPKCNDTYWSRLIVACAERMMFIGKAFVHYRYNNTESLQGNNNNNMECFLQAAIDVKEGLIQQGLWEHAPILTAYFQEARSLVRMPLFMMDGISAYRDYYYNAKEILIPEIFPSEREIADDPVLRLLHESNNFEEYIFGCLQLKEERIKELNKEYISKKSWDYKLGHVLLKIPRMILR